MISYKTIQVRFQDQVCFLKFDRAEVGNTINHCLIEECLQVLEQHSDSISILVLEGSPEVFCLGADLQSITDKINEKKSQHQSPEPLFDLWLKLASGPYITIAHVRGKVNAGGLGFVGACDIVLADETASFSLSELLFGIFPACVLPFLIKRIGVQRAHYLTLMTQPIKVSQAFTWGLVDAFEANSSVLLRKHLIRLRRLSKEGIRKYKSYMDQINGLQQLKAPAIRANMEMFSDASNLEAILKYTEQGLFPWEN